MSFSGKVVVVTGGSKGIGLACASAFLREGARVAIVSRDPANLEMARSTLDAKAGHLLTCATDLRSSAGASQMLASVKSEFGVPDILVNSAGAAKRTPALEADENDWRQAMDAKFFTYINAMSACLPEMIANKRGSIVNIVGMGGKVPVVTHLPGGAANSALMLVTAGMASACGPHGVRVNAVHPGPTLTDRLKTVLTVEARHEGVSEEEALRSTTDRLPLGRLAEPREIAEVVLFLTSDRASYVNGVNVPLDGGMFPSVV